MTLKEVFQHNVTGVVAPTANTIKVLTGNALQTIEGFEVTGTNYQPAVECLKHRYGRKRVIISSLVKSANSSVHLHSEFSMIH